MDKEIIKVVGIFDKILKDNQLGSIEEIKKFIEPIGLEIPDEKLEDKDLFLSFLLKKLNVEQDMKNKNPEMEDDEKTKTPSELDNIEILAETPYSITQSSDFKGNVITIPLHGETVISTSVDNGYLTLFLNTKKINFGDATIENVYFLKNRIPFNFSFINRIDISLSKLVSYDFENTESFKNDHVFMLFIPYEKKKSDSFNQVF